jgi:hypothetical protein
MKTLKLLAEISFVVHDVLLPVVRSFTLCSQRGDIGDAALATARPIASSIDMASEIARAIHDPARTIHDALA